jgi:hypothetical protein
VQLRDLHATTKLALAATAGLGAEESTQVTRRLPDLVEILTDKTRAQIDRGRWAVPDRTEDAELPYAIASNTDPAYRSPMLNGLIDASVAANILRDKTAMPVSPPSLPSALALLTTRRNVARPTHLSRGVARSLEEQRREHLGRQP